MDNNRDSEDDLPEPFKKSALSTPARETRKNMVQPSKQNNKLSPPQMKKTPKTSNYPSLQSLQQKTLISEEVRIKGQQKLMYLKQCHHKKYSNEQIFQGYPFSSMQIFTFDDEKLKDSNGSFEASIVQDQKGIHLIQQYRQTSHSRYITTQEQEEQNQFNGLSVSLFHNGNIFQGNYHNGKCCGLGYELQSNGNTYIGTFKDGVKNGHGTFYWFVNNQMYVGQWHGGLPHGSGVYLGKDRYQGNFLNGLKFGFGEENFSNGDKYIGEYVNSVADGYGQYFWSDSSVYKGDFKQGVRHGYGIWKDDNQTYKGNYRLDKKEGFGIYVWKNKQIYKGEFKDDFREGYGQFYSMVNGSEKLTYRGCWNRGKRNEQGKVDENIVKTLHLFLQRTEQFDCDIQQNSKKDKQKKRVGHRNCIPKESSPGGYHKH